VTAVTKAGVASAVGVAGTVEVDLRAWVAAGAAMRAAVMRAGVVTERAAAVRAAAARARAAVAMESAARAVEASAQDGSAAEKVASAGARAEALAGRWAGTPQLTRRLWAG
jgi:hypothetical protein